MTTISKSKAASFMKKEAELMKPYIEAGKKPDVELLIGKIGNKPVYSAYGLAPDLPFGEYEIFISRQFPKVS